MLLPLALVPVASAQDFQKIFDDFQKSAQVDFTSFVDRANMEYAEFMRKSWAFFEGQAPLEPPIQEEKILPPIEIPEEERQDDGKDEELFYDYVVPEPKPAPAPVPNVPIHDTPVRVLKPVTFTLYGTECKVSFDTEARPLLKESAEYSVADMWERLATMNGGDEMIADIYTQKVSMRLCDWAFYKYVEAFSKAVYSDREDDAAVLQTFILLQFGFDVRPAIGDDGHMYSLMAMECDLYRYSYFQVAGKKYYVIKPDVKTGMRVMDVEYPLPVTPARVSMEEENLFAENLSSPRHLAARKYPETTLAVSSNLNLMEFFKDYPLAYVNNDMRTKWRFYANVPVSHNVRTSMYPVFREVLADKSQLQAVNVLLNFVQTAFVYGYDDEIWGDDRSFFPDECVYYPYSDCEDRAIFFSRLVRDLTGLNVVLLYYPGHLAAAVRFNEDTVGDYITYNGEKYIVCDPTSYGPVGSTMDGMDNSSAFVVVL